MQTFLPYADFAASAAVLDKPRLGKQRVEALQVLRALTYPTYGWKRHPAVRMWAGFERGVAAYGLAVCVHVSHQAALVRKDPAYYGPLFPGTDPSLPYFWPV